MKRRFFKTKKVCPYYQRYREVAKPILETRTKIYADKTDIAYNRVTVRNQKTRWGSCSSLGNINLNYKLILLPQSIADYIIVHELCHRVHMNHSQRFWSLVEQFVPDYKMQIKELRKIESVTRMDVRRLIKAQDHYPADATTLMKRESDMDPSSQRSL